MKTRYRYKRTRYGLKATLVFLLVIAIVLISLYFTGVLDTALTDAKSPSEFSYDELNKYLEMERQTNTDWRFFACAVYIDGKYDEAFIDNLVNKYTSSPQNETEISNSIEEIFRGKSDDKQVKKYIYSLRIIDSLVKNGEFPMVDNYDYCDTWGASRDYGGDRTHEGTDIMCDMGTPIYAACSGTITRIGWNELGGYRIGITDENKVYFYYAHMIRYAEGMKKGISINKGDIIGYAGDTGYGPEGTTGKFAPHLHFGMYINGEAFNPYPYLKFWE